jgi:hypothetical protein
LEVQVAEGKAGTEAVMVFGQSPLAHGGEAEDALQDAEGMFYLRRTLGGSVANRG